MQSILKAFADGTLFAKTEAINNDGTYKQYVEQLCTLEDTLMKILDDNEREQLKALQETQSLAEESLSLARFVQGYRLGVLMTMEVLTGCNSLASVKDSVAK